MNPPLRDPAETISWFEGLPVASLSVPEGGFWMPSEVLLAQDFLVVPTALALHSAC